MKFTIIGSGGCVALPKPLCQCRVCKEARLKGKPYSRCGCSIYLEDIKLLVDTPEDISYALNYSNIKEVDTVLYSHMEPDHTLGMRVFEHMRLNWFDISEDRECTNPITVLAMKHVMEDINSIQSKYGSYLDYYEKVRNLIKRQVVEDYININDIKITFVKAGIAKVFVFKQGGNKVIYAPCDVKPFPNNNIFKNADVLIIGITIVGDVLKDGFVLKENNSFNEELFTMSKIKQLP
ncbi:MAG: MBL fold metallo-hydrolase [Clostridiaceae bacterium]